MSIAPGQFQPSPEVSRDKDYKVRPQQVPDTLQLPAIEALSQVGLSFPICPVRG